ncbi:hypothetical protein L873DRAFT_1900492 [Choiromyces venosus 120613-1]|uniref:Uncharacterized protein n=1 Tax=Choiromyces venosus 120613-1 TaxID=1336337 RepID=A0A3N4ISU9_9PEZI|nr:hypothetical protein L873DRAFT_1900492 [Choiromyces venosus 120613-1]
MRGDVVLESLPDPSDILNILLSIGDIDSKYFPKNIWNIIVHYPLLLSNIHLIAE